MTMQEVTAIDLAEGRETAINWHRLLKNIVDEYGKQQGIVHGVQKDAVQNGWDARSHHKGDGWSFIFQLHREQNGSFPVYVSMMDTGTHGLTGRVLIPEEMESDLPPEERWGRFQSLAFTKEEEEGAIGARGQGKFIFIGASKQRCIYYDSLREDGTYRAGVHGVVSRTSSRVHHWDEDNGRDLLKERFPSLTPLSEVGTRVIIVDPIDELLEALNDESLANMVSDTWWEIIQKHDATIVIRGDDKEWKAEVPSYLSEIPTEDTDGAKVWHRENDSIEVPGGNYRVKRLHLVWQDPEAVPSSVRGIAVQRSGMKVCIEEPPRDLPNELSDGVYGYIQFDNGLDRLMAVAEGVTHYDFDWRRRGAAQVRKYLRDQIVQFAYEKLGYGSSPETRRKRLHNKAEKRALAAANRVAEVVGLPGVGPGTTGPHRPDTPPYPPQPRKPIRIEMPELDLPGEGLRLEYGETVSNISVTAFNESDRNLQARLKLWMYTADGNVVLEFLPAVDFDFPKDTSKGPFGPFVVTMTENQFPTPGPYRIRARLVCLGCSSPDCPKGTILDEATRLFYLALDPPERPAGIFEKVEAVPRSDTVLGTYRPGERRGYIYLYNVEHRACEALGDDSDAISEYLFRLMSQAIVEIDLQSETPVLFDNTVLADPFRLAQGMGYLVGEWLNNYYE